MNKLLIIILSIFSLITSVNGQNSNSFTVDLARSFSRDIFENNGLPFLQPVVKVVNSTSNSGFFYDANIPSENEFYLKFNIQMMYGLVPESEKKYNPTMPTEEFNYEKAMSYVDYTYDIFKNEWKLNSIDTAGLIHYFFLNLMYDGIYGNNKGLINVPKSAPSALGNEKTVFELRNSALDSLVKAHPLYSLLDTFHLTSTIDSALSKFPNAFDLPPGGNINTIIAGIPQIVIGSYFGTELLIRWVPTLNLGSNIGKFNFWGLGLKHSVSQYFKSPIDIAVQAVYQNTNLNNTVGVTNAKLNAKAEILNCNLHLSYKVKNYFNIYSGLSLDNISIKSTYKYSLPITMQWQLGLIDQFAKDNNGNYLSQDEFGNPNNSKPTIGFPGDEHPQTAYVNLEDNQIRYTFGISKEFHNFIISADYNFGKLSVFGASIGYKF